MVDILDLSKVREDKDEAGPEVSEQEEAANSMRKLLGDDADLEHESTSAVQVIPEFEPLVEGEVRFIQEANQAISCVLASGTHVELPYITKDSEVITELTAWADHVGCISVVTFEDEQGQ